MPATPIVRHQRIDRVFHWTFGLVILILLATGLLPKLGVNFSWVVIHWVCGVVLILMTVVHIVRSVFWKKLKAMWIEPRDFTAAAPGKYSLAQKLMHNFIGLITLVVCITGGLMMVRIDTPFWERNPYWLSSTSWGFIYVLHGLMALIFVSTIMLHIYFSLRPEKRHYLRSMLKGWITREEYEQEHDARRWPVNNED